MYAKSSPRLVLVTTLLASCSPLFAQSDRPSRSRGLPATPTTVAGPTGSAAQSGGAHPPTSSVPSTERSRSNGDRTRTQETRKTLPPAHGLLETRVDSIDWTEEPLEDVIDWLRDQGRVNVVVIWRTLDYLGLDKETTVTLKLQNAKIHAILSEVCEQLAPGAEMGFQAYGNMLRIASQEYFDRVLYTRVYDVADLIWEPREFIPAQNAPNSFGLNAPAMVGGGGEVDTYRFPEERRKELAEALRNSIAPHQWEENGGNWSLTVWQNALIVRAPMRIHQQLVGEFYLP